MSENIRQIRKDLAEGYRYLEVAEAKLRQGNVPSAEVDEINKKAMEVEELQGKVDQYDKISGIAAKGREVMQRKMPGDGRDRNNRGVTATPGHIFATSDALATYVAQGKQGWSAKVDIKTLRGEAVKLYGDEADKYMARLESKDFTGAGSGVPTRPFDTFPERGMDPDVVRIQEPEILTIRDVLQVMPTSDDTVRHVRYEYTDAAAAQDGEGGLKPYSTIVASAVNVPLETIAVLHKVPEQALEDTPRMITIINEEMRRDVKVEEERQLLWGDGEDGEIDGLWGELGAYEFARAQVDDTIIDTIRRIRTDIRKRKGVPNFVAIDPIDWENTELAKGTVSGGGDGHYVWGLVSDLRGPRIWSLRVVESDAMEAADGSRRLLVGDGVRGATIYDRHDVRLAVGFINDDFGRNLRTLRAEERIALAVKRPWLFGWAETAEAES
jgi:hypothetical protein